MTEAFAPELPYHPSSYRRWDEEHPPYPQPPPAYSMPQYSHYPPNYPYLPNLPNSSPSHPMYHPSAGVLPPGMMMPPYPPPAFTWNHRPHAMVEYITDIAPQDVLSGRGGATNSHSGNKVFRSLVKEYQEQYLHAKKRDKPSVADLVVQRVRERGGRFLRRWDTDASGNVLWVDIGDLRAREKTCQALREGAPELRRRRKSDDDHSVGGGGRQEITKTHTVVTHSPVATSSPSSMNDSSREPGVHSSPELPRSHTIYNDESPKEDMIYPIPAMLVRDGGKPLSVHQLTDPERRMYWNDFMPPHPDRQ